MSKSKTFFSWETLAAQAMGHVDPATRAIIPAAHLITTYLRDVDNACSSGFVYGPASGRTIVEPRVMYGALRNWLQTEN